VKLLQATSLKVSSLFLDIKGDFNNIRGPIVAARLRAHNTPMYIINWVLSFPSERSCHLLFKGGPGTFEAVDVGVPQGSPISPLLFVIYVAPFHHIPLPKGITLSYVDYFAMTKASNSYRTNTRHLQRAWFSLQEIGASLHITFSIPKTELIHWRTHCDRSIKYIGPISLDDNLFHPLEYVQWLGFCFTITLTTHHHFQQRYINACRTFGYLKSLAKPGSGLTAHNARTLACAIILPTLLYCAEDFLPKTAALNKLNRIWTRVLLYLHPHKPPLP
jgi:hypothetical protein